MFVISIQDCGKERIYIAEAVEIRDGEFVVRIKGQIHTFELRDIRNLLPLAQVGVQGGSGAGTTAALREKLPFALH